jgi:hypothetical protein
MGDIGTVEYSDETLHLCSASDFFRRAIIPVSVTEISKGIKLDVSSNAIMGVSSHLPLIAGPDGCATMSSLRGFSERFDF